MDDAANAALSLLPGARLQAGAGSGVSGARNHFAAVGNGSVQKSPSRPKYIALPLPKKTLHCEQPAGVIWRRNST